MIRFENGDVVLIITTTVNIQYRKYQYFKYTHTVQVIQIRVCGFFLSLQLVRLPTCWYQHASMFKERWHYKAATNNKLQRKLSCNLGWHSTSLRTLRLPILNIIFLLNAYNIPVEFKTRKCLNNKFLHV